MSAQLASSLGAVVFPVCPRSRLHPSIPNLGCPEGKGPSPIPENFPSPESPPGARFFKVNP